MAPRLMERWPPPPAPIPDWQLPACPGRSQWPSKAALTLGVVAPVLVVAQFFGLEALANDGSFPGWYPQLLVAPLAGALGAVVLGAVALGRRHQGVCVARDQAVAGIILGVVGLILLVGLWFFEGLLYVFSQAQWGY